MQNPRFRTLGIISLALHASVVMYIVVAFVALRGAPASVQIVIPEEHKILFFALTAMSFMMIPMILMLPSIIKPKGASVHSQDVASPEVVGSKPHLFLDYEKIDDRIQQLTILRLAFAEAIAIYGLVLAFIMGNPVMVIPYALVSLITQIIFGPFVGKLMGRSSS